MTSTQAGLGDLLYSTATTPKHEWRKVLIATDGDTDGDGAWSVAHALRKRSGAEIRAIGVAEPAGVVFDPAHMGFETLLGAATIEQRAAAVQSQAERFMPHEACPIVVRTGPVVEEVQLYARQIHADLILTGRGQHHATEGLFGGVHLMRLLQSAPCPVFAAMRGRGLYHRIVIGIDFSESSLELGLDAVSLAAPDAAIYLVHVKPNPPFGLPHPGRWLDSYDDGVREGIDSVRIALKLPRARVVQTIVVHGHPGVALAALAQARHADLLAVGLHGAGLMHRRSAGSVSSALVRSAPCSLLFVPSRDQTAV